MKFRVVLSSRSSKAIYEKGIESIPSESACYPAKITHGHIENLIARGVPFIFYPSVAYERLENEDAEIITIVLWWLLIQRSLEIMLIILNRKI